jgi:hypothetical protein
MMTAQNFQETSLFYWEDLDYKRHPLVTSLLKTLSIKSKLSPCKLEQLCSTWVPTHRYRKVADPVPGIRPAQNSIFFVTYEWAQ